MPSFDHLKATAARAAAAALWGSVLAATVPLFVSSLPAFAIAATLMLPVALALALAWAVAFPLVARAGGRLGVDARRACLLVEVPLVTLLGGIYLDNQLVVDSPFGRCARIGYAVTLAAAAVGAGVAWVATRGWTGRSGARAWELASGAALLVDALIVGALDAYGVRQEYPIHGLLLLLTLTGFTGAAFGLLPGGRAPRWLGAGALGLGVALLGWFAPSPAAAYRRAMRAHTPHAEAISRARAWTDRDGDGFSAWFGDGDCDDADPRAYPLSPARDCLGWIAPGADAGAAPSTIAAAPAIAPRVILLLTIDAFRCGFGAREAAPLRDGCPRLRRLAAEGRARLDAHTNVPTTSWSMAVLMGGGTRVIDERPAPSELLPARLRRLGYRSEVVLTLPHILTIEPLPSAFDRVDDALLSTVTSPFRGDAVSARTLDHVRAALADPAQRTFIWAHYPDLHYPFIVDDRPWKHSSVDAYATLLRRTDAAIGRLCDALARLPGGEDVLVVITADHGEEFGEHGERYHGLTLYEGAMRIPILVWSPGAHRRFGAATVPAQLADLASYIESAAALTPPRARPDVLLRTLAFDRQLGVIADGWKLIYNHSRHLFELYDLAHDPSERHDLARRRPDLVTRLGRRLGALLLPDGADQGGAGLGEP